MSQFKMVFDVSLVLTVHSRLVVIDSLLCGELKMNKTVVTK